MKLLSVQLARTTWTFDISETNPLGKNIFADLVPMLIERYGFKKAPQEGGDFSKGMVFTLGAFTNRSRDQIAVGLTIWSDGIAADTWSSTDDSDEFLEAAIKMLPEMGYQFDQTMVQHRGHTSQIIVRCQGNLSMLNPQLESFARKLSASIGSSTVFQPAALEFWPDPTQASKPVRFSFQRKNGTSFSDNRYWSQAGTTTKIHLELLEELEAILS